MPERVTLLDWMMMVLAMASVLLLAFEEAFGSRLPPAWTWWIVYADLAIVAIFAVEFLSRLAAAKDRWSFVKSHWYDLLGLIPVSHPMFRGFRLLRLLRIAVLLSRVTRASARTFGERAVEVALSRFKHVIAEVLAQEIVARSVAIIRPSLVRARFAEALGSAMQERRSEIRALVRRNLERSPGAGWLLGRKPIEEFVRATEEAALDAVIETLQSEEMNRIVQDATARFLDELTRKVEPDAAPPAPVPSPAPQPQAAAGAR